MTTPITPADLLKRYSRTQPPEKSGDYVPARLPSYEPSVAAADEAQGGDQSSLWQALLARLEPLTPHFPPDEGSVLGRAWSGVKTFATPQQRRAPPAKVDPQIQEELDREAAAQQGLSLDAYRWNKSVDNAPVLRAAVAAAAMLPVLMTGKNFLLSHAMRDTTIEYGMKRAAAFREMGAMPVKNDLVNEILAPVEHAVKQQLKLGPGQEPSDLPSLLSPRFPPEPGSPADRVWQEMKKAVEGLLNLNTAPAEPGANDQGL